MMRLMTLSASRSGCAARTSAAMPATIGRGAARAVPPDEAAVGRDPDEVLAGRRDADRDALGRRLEARLALGVDARDRQHARDRRGRADAGGAAAPVAGRDHDDDVVVERVQERVIPALVPVGGVGRERQIDDIGAVVDRPADRVGDLLGERARRRRAETDRDREQLGLGCHADHAGAGTRAPSRPRARRPSCRGWRRPRRPESGRRRCRRPTRRCRRRRRR